MCQIFIVIVKNEQKDLIYEDIIIKESDLFLQRIDTVLSQISDKIGSLRDEASHGHTNHH